MFETAAIVFVCTINYCFEGVVSRPASSVGRA